MPTSPSHRQPPTAFGTHNGRSFFASGTALHAPRPSFSLASRSIWRFLQKSKIPHRVTEHLRSKVHAKCAGARISSKSPELGIVRCRDGDPTALELLRRSGDALQHHATRWFSGSGLALLSLKMSAPAMILDGDRRAAARLGVCWRGSPLPPFGCARLQWQLPQRAKFGLDTLP